MIIIENKLYPWQKNIWQRLQTMRQKLPHALLLKGGAGSGKLAFAQNLAQSLLCKQPNTQGMPCESCHNCLWFKEGNHPDYKLIQPEIDAEQSTTDSSDEGDTSKKKKKKSVIIKIDQIRELLSFLSLTNHQQDGQRIVIISPAETMNIEASNALLKMLEEPPQNTIFLLISHQAQRLLPTIMSRCQLVEMPLPDENQAIEWLENQGINDVSSQLSYAGGSPLLALKQVEQGASPWQQLADILAQGAKLNPFIAAPLFLSANVTASMDYALTALQKWCADLLSCKLTQQVRYHTNYTKALQGLSKSVHLNLLLELNVTLLNAKKMASHPLNNELQLENILLSYSNMFKK